jgi:anti-anti-sigma regulatory factor
MNITVEKADAVTIMKLQGELDASCYTAVIEKANILHSEGMRQLLLDLGDMTFMSSSGLVALHSIAMLMRGETTPDPESGWGAMHAISHNVEEAAGYEANCKLLNPQPRVEKTLNITGFNKILEVFTDSEAAVASV